MNEALILGGLVVVSAIMILYSLMPAKKNDRDKILQRMSGRRDEGGSGGSLVKQRKKKSEAKQVMDKVPEFAIKPVMPSEEDMSTLRQRMAQAGFRHDSATRVFPASKTILGAGLAGAVEHGAARHGRDLSAAPVLSDRDVFVF